MRRVVRWGDKNTLCDVWLIHKFFFIPPFDGTTNFTKFLFFTIFSLFFSEFCEFKYVWKHPKTDWKSENNFPCFYRCSLRFSSIRFSPLAHVWMKFSFSTNSYLPRRPFNIYTQKLRFNYINKRHSSTERAGFFEYKKIYVNRECRHPYNWAKASDWRTNDAFRFIDPFSKKMLHTH